MIQKENLSALHVQAGIEQPDSVSPYLKTARIKKRPELTVDDYISGIVAGNRVVLSQAITLIESVNPHHFEIAQKVIEKALPYSGNSMRVGITGVPGVGKSTFIEALGKQLTEKGHKLAVLAIDPSSERSKGSILGDKTRMEDLSVDKNAFIRPSPSGLNLGGVARKTRETIILCEAAGFDVIFVETVGVGQSETVVKTMVDFFLLLMLAGAGDELQGIKRGIMEMADALIITKADGDNIQNARLAQSLYISALRLFPQHDSKWVIPVDICSAVTKSGVNHVWDIILEYKRLTKENGYFEQYRTEQLVRIFYDWMENTLKDNFYNNPQVKEGILRSIPEIKSGKITPYQAGGMILKLNIKPLE